MVFFPKISSSGVCLTGSMAKPLSVKYPGHPIRITAASSQFAIIRADHLNVNTPYLLVQTPFFDNGNPEAGHFKGLWDNTPVEIGRECKDTERFALDLRVSRKHFKITRHGDEFIIENLSSTKGITVDQSKLEEDMVARLFHRKADLVAQENVEKVLSQEFFNVLSNESMGGNAGRGHVAVNSLIDANCEIIIFGNIQNLPQKIREYYENGLLYSVGIRVKFLASEGPNFIYYLDKGSATHPLVYERIEEVLKLMVQKLNEIPESKNPFLKFGRINFPLHRDLSQK